MNWRHQRDKFGKIRRNQIWKKYHDGVTIQILHKSGGKGWVVHFLNRSGMRGKSHTIEERMIYHYFERIS